MQAQTWLFGKSTPKGPFSSCGPRGGEAARLSVAVFFLLCQLLVGCAGDTQRVPPADREAGAGGSPALHAIFERYFEGYLSLYPTLATSIGDHRYDDQLAISISDAHRARQEVLYRASLDELATLDRSTLDPRDARDCRAFERMLRARLTGLRFPQDLLPLRQIESLPVDFPLLGSGRAYQPFKTPADYDNFLKRMSAFPAWVDTAIEKMQLGITRHVVQPRPVMERTLPLLDAMVVADPAQSLFLQPVRQLPADFLETDRARLSQAYEKAVEQDIVPAYRKLHTFVQKEYLPATRSTVGMWALPGGNRWYTFLVRSYTSTPLTPDAIFQLGMEEIARITGEMEEMRRQSHFAGSLAEFGTWLWSSATPAYTTRADLVKGYEMLRAKVAGQLPRLFGRLPRARFEIRTVEEFRERAAPSQYWSAATDGTRPGIFYVNAAGIGERAPRRVSESLFLHEAVPGHHFQLSLLRENERVPRFRRHGGYTAFTEGWALYAEGLGEELGVYREPFQRFGRLSSELFRAARLVVDVGLHRKKWSRQQAIRFLRETTGTREASAAQEVDRYIAWPGQALAYKIGQLRILAIRHKAEQALGASFDIREFHDELLKDGAMPLDLLEEKMNAWIERRAS